MKNRISNCFFSLLMGLLLAASLVTSSGPMLRADVSASSLQATGSAQISGPLIGFFQEQKDNQTGGASPSFSLQASHLRVETDSTDPSLHLVVAAPKLKPNMTRSSYDESLTEGISNGPGYRFNVFSSDEARPSSVNVVSACSRANPSHAASIARIPVVADTASRPATSRDVSKSLQWGCLEDASIQVRGDFWVSLWAWDATLNANNQAHELHSGQRQSGQVPAAAPDASGTVSHDQEVYLFVTNGTLTIPRLTGTGWSLYTGPGTTLTAGNLEAHGATGSLNVDGTTLNLRESMLRFEGETQAVLAGKGVQNPLQAQVAGSADQIVVDGQVLAITTTPPSAFPWAWLFGAVGAVMAPVLAPTMRRRVKAARARHLDALAEQAMAWLGRGHPEQAHKLASKILDLKPDHALAHCLEAVSLGRLREYPSALIHHRRAADLLRQSIPVDLDLIGENALHAALSAATWTPLAGRQHQETVAWLRQALHAKPSLHDQLRHHPELRPYLADLLDDPAIQ